MPLFTKLFEDSGEREQCSPSVCTCWRQASSHRLHWMDQAPVSDHVLYDLLKDKKRVLVRDIYHPEA